MMKYYEDEEFNDQNVPELEGAEFCNCTFTGIEASEVSLKSSKFIECSFKQSNLSNAKIVNTSFRDVRFDSCKLVGINWSSSASLFEISFHECMMNYCVFHELNLNSIVFRGSALVQVDFTLCELKKADFSNCELKECQFSRCQLQEANFVGATRYVIDFEENKVKKAKFSLPEALSLLSQFEITIE